MSSRHTVDFLSAESQTHRVYDCFHDRPHVEPYADISGIGVHVGYLGTAYLVIVILTGYYFIAFDPFSSPFTAVETPLYSEESAGISAGISEEKHEIVGAWKPNPIDVACLRFFRRLFLGSEQSSPSELPTSRLQNAFRASVLTLCDVQTATGTGILISAYALLGGEEGISVYHWMIVVYLAWFANLTHLTGLTFLRPHLHRHPNERNWRLVFIISLFILLFVANIPTIYFGTATYPSYARCFFDIKTVTERIGLHDPHGRKYELVSAPAIVSMVLLAVGSLTRVVKGSRRVSRDLMRLRQWGSRLTQVAIRHTARVSSSTHFIRTRPKLQHLWGALVVRPLVAVFLTWRLYVDLCTSTLSEIFWLWIAVIWGTAHIVQLRRFSYLEVSDESRLTFGQIHPILLLVLPLIPVIVQLGASVPELWQSDEDEMSDLDITCDDNAKEDDSTPLKPKVGLRNDLEYLARHHDDHGSSLLYSAPWSTATIWLAKAQAIFFTITIFGELFYNLNLTRIMASLIAWIVFMQASACYILILLGLSSRGVGSTWLPRMLADRPRARGLLSINGATIWWLVVLVVFSGYSLSPIWTSGRYSADHEHSPVLQTLYRDHFAVPVAMVFQLVYSVFVGAWLVARHDVTLKLVKETQERQVLD